MFAFIENGIVKQLQPYPQNGFIEVPDNTVCGQIDNGDGTFSNPPKTPDQILAAKWTDYNEYCRTLTVTTLAGNKFATDPAGLRNVVFKRDSIADTAQVLWVEDWGSFTTDKVELQEVVNEASALMQAKILELFGV